MDVQKSLSFSRELFYASGARKNPGIIAADAAMSFLFAYTAESWQITISGLMADVFTIKADFIRACIAEMPRKVALSASRNLGGVFHINLLFAEPQILWNGFNYANAIVSQPIIDIWCEGMFSPSIMEDLAKRS